MRYAVLLHGENFLLEMDGSLGRHGFFTTRVVDADLPKEAERAAIATLRNDEFLQAAVRNSREDSPMLYAEEIRKLSECDDAVDMGFSFYAATGEVA